MWLFHLHNMIKYRFFILFFHWRNPQLKYFVGYPFGFSKRKVSTISYDTVTGKRLYFPPHCRVETTTYYNRALWIIPSEFQKIRHQPFLMTQPFKKDEQQWGGYVFGGDSACSRYAHAWFAQVRNSWEGVRRIPDCVLGCVVVLYVIIWNYW